MSDYIHINGQLVPYDAAVVGPGDAGLLHGAGLFETMRARKGKIFRARQHLERMTKSAEALGIAFVLGEDQLAEMATELLEANGLMGGEARMRLTVTRGDLHAVTAEEPVPPVTLMLSATAMTGFPAEAYEKGMTVVLSRYKQNPENPLCGHKSTSYFDRLLALREAHGARAGEALWFTAKENYLAEACTANVFVVDKDGHLATPPLLMPGKEDQRLCLPGITRQVVMEVATGMQVLVHERMLTVEDVLGAREVLLTNAIMGVMPVTRMERHEVGAGKVGEMAVRLRAGYEEALARGA